MAIGPIARVVVQAAVMGIAILAKAIPRAYGAALNNARKGGVDATKASEGFMSKKKMNLDEAMMIMNIEKNEVTPELIQKQYDKYFAVNAIEKGGSFYLQSKIYRAKEQLDEFIKEKQKEEQKEDQEGGEKQ